VQLNIGEMNIADSCEGLLALIRPLAERKGISLSLRLGASSLPGFSGKPGADLPIVRTDPQKLEQAVFNFLSNAVKFTPEGGEVTLRAERLSGGDDTPRVRLSVLDTGPGIAAEHQQAIFEKFRQLEEGHTKTVTGTGLGLSIAKQFVEMLQGEIQLVSEVGRGSMFSIIIPVQIDEERLAREAKEREDRTAEGADATKIKRSEAGPVVI
jgi:signal transduction histidine kinase